MVLYLKTGLRVFLKIFLIYRVVQKKVYDCVCSLHLIKKKFFFDIFSFCVPKHTICFKQTFFSCNRKSATCIKKYQKPWSKKSKKNCKIIILRAKHFNLYYFLFYFRSKDKGVRRIFSKSINKKSINEFNILNLC